LTSWTLQNGFTEFQFADLMSFYSVATTVQATAGTNTLNVATQSGDTLNGWVTATIAVKAANAGTLPVAGIHVDKVFHTNVLTSWSAATATMGLPTKGSNGLILAFAAESGANVS